MQNLTHITQSTSLAEAFYRIASSEPDLSVYSQATLPSDSKDEGDTPRKWRTASFIEVKNDINKIARTLRSQGVQKGSKVAIISQTRPEWMKIDLAILALGGVSVSVYQTLPADDIAYILYDSGAEIVFAENQEQVDKIAEVLSRPFDMPATEDRESTSVQLSLKKVVSIEDSVWDSPLLLQLSEILSEEPADSPQETSSIQRQDLAALVYTSGTTGPPKGVMQSHENHLSNVRQAFDSGFLQNDPSICLFLPLAHSFAKLMGYIGFLSRVELRFPAVVDSQTSKLNPQSTTKDIRESNSNIFPVVPRLLEKMRDGVLAARNEAGVKGKLVTLALWAASDHYASIKAGQKPKVLTLAAYRGTEFLRKKLQQKLFGESLQFVLSGGAKLPVDVNEFFDALGIKIIEGYGLTETCVATNVGRVGITPIGSVGPVLADDIEMRINEDGEIIFRGPNVALGYFNRSTATKGAWDEDGWFHTGDLGAIDEKKNLTIVGRKKEIIVTSGGKNIAPNDIEERIKHSPLVSQAVMLGDGRKYCIALITLNLEEAKQWAKRERIPNADEPLHENKELQQKIWAHVQKVNEELARHETIKKIHIVPEDFTVENGLLTPTFKVKRSVIEKLYEAEINSLY